MLDGKEKIKLIAVIMRHLGGYHHGYFHHAGYGSRGIAPGRLIYHLSDAMLLDGVGIAFARRQHVAYLLLRMFRMTTEQIHAYQ